MDYTIIEVKEKGVPFHVQVAQPPERALRKHGVGEKAEKAVKASFKKAMDSVSFVLKEAATQLNATGSEERPSELEVEFGVSFEFGGKVSIVSGKAASTFKVKAKWVNSSSSKGR